MHYRLMIRLASNHIYSFYKLETQVYAGIKVVKFSPESQGVFFSKN